MTKEMRKMEADYAAAVRILEDEAFGDTRAEELICNLLRMPVESINSVTRAIGMKDNEHKYLLSLRHSACDETYEVQCEALGKLVDLGFIQMNNGELSRKSAMVAILIRKVIEAARFARLIAP